MHVEISNLICQVESDPWRSRVGFSPDLKHALNSIAIASDAEAMAILNEWVARHQPCLFGRIAAKRNLLAYCILREVDLQAPVEHLRAKIHAAHLEWTQRGFEGDASGFIVVVISDRLATAEPNGVVLEIAVQLCSLLLDVPVKVDQVYLDELWLQQPGREQVTWAWPVGVNYFSAQGDQRWWRDHRFPAAIAFSLNSVGHMVKSGKLASAMRDLEELMGTAEAETFRVPVVVSLEKALELAMQTIDMAVEGPSGKATRLLPLPADKSGLPPTPCPLRGKLAEMNHCTYGGHYHTDYTLPSEYFRPEVERPADLQEYDLDFTYLFHHSATNPDGYRMGEGKRIRASGPMPDKVVSAKLVRGVAIEKRISDIPRLRKALGI